MTHPLEDEVIDRMIDKHGFLFNTHVEFLVNNRIIEEVRAVARDAADWQLEQVLKWLRTQTDYSGTFYYETPGDIETIEDALRNAMRPQDDN